MIYLFVFLSMLLWICSILGYGSIILFLKKFNSNFSSLGSIKITILGIFGFIILSSLSSIFNFFIPLNIIFISIIFSIGFILFIINLKKIFVSLKTYHFIFFFILLGFFAFAPFNWQNHYDSGLYYIQSIKWINESQLPFGLANLHGRLGFNSSWLINASIVEPFLLLKNSPIFLINSIISFFVALSVFLNMFEKINYKLQFSDIYLFLISIPLFLRIDDYIASASPDLPSMLIVLFIFYLLIKAYEEFENYRFYHFIAIIVSCFVLTIKISTAPVLIGCVFSLIYSEVIKNKKRNKEFTYWGVTNKYYFNILIITSFFSILVWIIRNIVISGCIVYPVGFGHFKNLKWSVSYDILKNDNDWIRSWARDNTKTPAEVLGNWNWFGSWFQNFIKNEKLLFFIIITGLLLIIFWFFRKFKNKSKNKMIIPLIVSISISVFGIIFWFFSAPDRRFGYGFLYSFAILILSYSIYLNEFDIKKINYKKAFFILIIAIILIWGGDSVINGNSVKSVVNNKFIKMPVVEHELKTTKSNIKINIPINTDQSWNYELPSTPYFNNNLEAILDNGTFRMFYFSD